MGGVVKESSRVAIQERRDWLMTLPPLFCVLDLRTMHIAIPQACCYD